MYLILGSLALSILAWADWRGAGAFDDLASRNPTRLGSGQQSTFHK
jgi:hypothetical protein